MLSPGVTNVWSARLAQTSISASDRRSQSADTKLSGSTQDGSLSQQIARVLLGDSVAVAIQTGLKTSLESSPDLCPWTEGDNELLCHDNRIYVPEAFRATIIKRHHDNPLAGHFGTQKTLELISWHYYWPLPSEVRKILQKANSDKENKNNSILVVVNRLTKMVHYIPVTDKITAQELYEVLDREVFSVHGLPDSIVSDRDSLIISRYWKALMRYMTIDRQMSTAFWPQTDGQTKCQNSPMEQYLRAYINFEQDDWVTWLPKAEFAYNNAYNNSTKMTPFFANLGYHPRMSYEHDPDKRSTYNQSAIKTITKHREILAMLKHKLAAAQKHQATAHNWHAIERSYDVGKWVYLNRKSIKTTAHAGSWTGNL